MQARRTDNRLFQSHPLEETDGGAESQKLARSAPRLARRVAGFLPLTTLLVLFLPLRPIPRLIGAAGGALLFPFYGLLRDATRAKQRQSATLAQENARLQAIARENARLQEQMQELHRRLNAEHEAAASLAGKMAKANQARVAAQTELEAKYLALEEANARLRSLATTDSMTGLANHRAFQEELSRQIARVHRSAAPLSLLLLDVDHFKKYNDSFGHPSGDEVLKTVGKILQTMVREGDFPARHGGEEFAVILPDADAETAEQIAERIRAAIEAHPFPHRTVTASIGVAQYSLPATPNAMLQYTDVALYEAKSAGRNRVIAFYPQTTACTDDEESPAQESGYSRAAFAAEGEETRLASLGFGEGEASEEDELVPVAPRLLASLLDGGLEGMLQEPSGLILADLLSALDRRSSEPYGHTERVTRYALRLGLELAALYDEKRQTRPLVPRLTQGDMASLAFGALLHDIGKVGIPDYILNKTGKLTDDEWRQIRRHPMAGADLISRCQSLLRALPVVRFHHENWDGTGYPQGLAAEAIPLAARIFAVCDALDALMAEKPYRTAHDYAEARQKIACSSGAQFDPDVVEAFLRVPENEWLRLSQLEAPLLPQRLSLPYAA